jgi:microcystin-dependent protein
MSKLTRVFQNLFMLNGSSAHSEQFGAKVQTGSAVPTLDPASIQAGAAFIGQGWSDAIVGANKQPYLEDMNGLHRLIFYQLCQIFQDGVPVWDPSTPYFTGSIVRKDGTSELYGSLIDNNVGNPLPNQTANGQWNFLTPPGEQPGIIKDYAGASAPFGYLMCDGSSYAQAAFPALFNVVGTGWNTYRGVADPGAGNFRVPDLRGQTTIMYGQAPGLTNRVYASFTGEEAHAQTVAELAVHNHVTTYMYVAGAINGNFGLADLTNVSPEPTTPPTTQNTGSGTPFNVMQPSCAVNKVIKT